MVDIVKQLCDFINASPTPYHAANSVAKELQRANWVPLSSDQSLSNTSANNFFYQADGFLVAASLPKVADPSQLEFRILVGHTDSPNLRLKTKSTQAVGADLRVMSAEPYGGVIYASWLDRDLGIAGRLIVEATELQKIIPQTGWEITTKKINETLQEIQFFTYLPIFHIPRLAIHLTKERNQEQLNPQLHLNPLSDLNVQTDFLEELKGKLGLPAQLTVYDYEVMLHPLPGAQLVGINHSLLSSPRLDNQVSCFVASKALSSVYAQNNIVPVVALFNHEEVGSGSAVGAQSSKLTDYLEELIYHLGGNKTDFLNAKKRSFIISSDMAHGSHPNYLAKQEDSYPIDLTGGIVIKINHNQRYASETTGIAQIKKWLAQLNLPVQEYINRADLPCGTTIGPLTAVSTGIRTVDVGLPQLAMHSAMELMSTKQIANYIKFITYFFSSKY